MSSYSLVPQTVDNTTSDLEAALKRGGIAGPYVMVGHSLGSYESLLFTDRHRRDVVGMVLVDPLLSKPVIANEASGAGDLRAGPSQ